jgi:hypothetical protein
VGSTGSRWTTGPLTSPHPSGQNPGQLALQERRHVFRGEYDEVAAATVGVTDDNTAQQKQAEDLVGFLEFLFAAPCVAESSEQQWQLSPGIQPRDAVGTIIELAGSNSTLSLNSQGPIADKMCWRVLGCMSTDGAAVGIGHGCTLLPPQAANGSYECGDHNCACNGGFAFHNDGTIRSLMDGHCLELLEPDRGSDTDATARQSITVATTPCSGKASQQFTTSSVGSAFTISQIGGGSKSVCIQTSPGPPPPRSCSSFKNHSACLEAQRCVWRNGVCQPPPKPAPPPPRPMQPAVPEEDWDQFFQITDNYIGHMPLEYHSAIGIFAGYIANSSISHNTLEHLSYDGIQFGE